MSALIETRNLVKTYGSGDVGVRALRDVTIRIDPRSFVAIMGPSGSGKSTFINIIGCLDRPTSGEYLLDGLPTASLTRDELAEIRNTKIGFIFQNFNLLARFNILENVALPLLYARNATNVEQRATSALASVKLSGREHSYCNQLSGGQQQRVAIARALINNPQILLADEPTGQLDSATSEDIMRIFVELNRTRGLTILLVTHSDEIAAYADRLVRFRDGRIVSDSQLSHTDAARHLLEVQP